MAASPFGWLDSYSQTLAQDSIFSASGWAVDPDTGSPVSSVQLHVDNKFVATAQLGGSRTDVAAAFNNPAYAQSGYTVTWKMGYQTPGTHTFSIIAYDSQGDFSHIATNNTFQVTGNLAAPDDVRLTPSPIDSQATVFGTIFGYEMVNTTTFPAAPQPIFQPYNRNDPGWWSNAVDELLFSKIQVVMFLNRGIGHGSTPQADPQVLYMYRDAIKRSKSERLLKVHCFIDTAALTEQFNMAFPAGPSRPPKYDFTFQDSAAKVLWDRFILPFYNQFRDDKADWHCYAPPGWPASRPIITIWALSPNLAQNYIQGAAGTLTRVADLFQAHFGVRPVFHLDGSWSSCSGVATHPDVLGFNDWFRPSSGLSYTFVPSLNNPYPSYKGKKWGVVVPGFYPWPGPLSLGQIPEAAGLTLQNGLAQSYSQAAEYTILEGWTNFAENAGYYRSNSWTYPNQHINSVREYADRSTRTLRFQAEACDSFSPSVGVSNRPFRQDGVNTVSIGLGEWAVESSQPNAWIQYRQVLLSHGRYRFSVRAAAGSAGKSVRLWIGSNAGAWSPVPAGGFQTITLGEYFVSHGRNDIRLECDSPGIMIDWLFSKKTSDDIVLRTSGGYFLQATLGGRSTMNASALGTGPWETFSLANQTGPGLKSGDSVVLQSNNGHYLTALNNGGASVACDRTSVSPSEQFTVVKTSAGDPIIRDGDRVAFRSSAGFYLVAENGGNSAVNCNRNGIGEWEQFTIYFR